MSLQYIDVSRIRQAIGPGTAECYAIRTISVESTLLDSVPQCIRCLLSCTEAALCDLDSLSSRSAAGEERVAPSEFAVLPGAFCNRANHVVTPEKNGTEVASRRLTSGEHPARSPSRWTTGTKKGDANSMD
jgi:hypothetical protein